MKHLLIFIYFVSFGSMAFCGEESLQRMPFAKEMEQHQDWRTFEVFFPVSESSKARTMYLSSLSVTVPKVFEVELNTSLSETNDSFYSAFFRVDKNLISSVQVVGGYNATNKERTGLSFCGNFKKYNLTELINN